MSEDISKLIHDMNSDISALLQALQVMEGSYIENPELLGKMLPLSVKKAESLLENWEEVKKIIPKDK